MAEIKIRVRAKPSFPCLRRGFVQQRMLLTRKGIDAIRHGPFTAAIMISLYKNVSVKNGLRYRSRFSEQQVKDFRTGKIGFCSWLMEKRLKIGVFE